MKVLVTHEYHYLEYKGGFYDPRNYTAGDHHANLLAVFDKIVLVGRCKKTSKQPNCQRVDSERVEFIPVTDFNGHIGLIGWLRAWRQCKKVAGLADRYWLRAPGVVASLVAWHLKRKGIRFYLDMAGDPADVARAKTQWLPHRISELFGKLIAKRFRKLSRSSQGVLAVTRSTLQNLYPSAIPENDFGISRVRLPDEILQQPNRDFRTKELGIIIVGVLLKYKGHKYLLKALGKIQSQRNWSLKVVGQGAQKENLERLAKKLGIAERVDFCGRIDWGPKLFAELDKAHLFVLSSLTEGMPRVVIEAMARGLPVIATDVGGVHEILPAEYTVPAKDSERLAEAISRLWNDPQKLQATSEANFRQAKDFALSRTSLLRRAWLSWMKECGEEPGEKKWPEYARNHLPENVLRELNLRSRTAITK